MSKIPTELSNVVETLIEGFYNHLSCDDEAMAWFEADHKRKLIMKFDMEGTEVKVCKK